MRPSEIPSWSAWMIARTKLDSSGERPASAIFFNASWRPSPMRISPSASSNSSMSGPSMCSISFEIARVEAETRLDADREQVERVRQLRPTAVCAALDARSRR